jgi:hypothetical protein
MMALSAVWFGRTSPAGTLILHILLLIPIAISLFCRVSLLCFVGA